LEKLSDVEHVFLGGAGEDEDVVKVDEDEPVQHVIARNIINKSLEHSWGVGKAKWHDQILVVIAVHVEDSLPIVPFPYPHQVVGIP
jgi:hypothetical protein